MRGEDPWSTPDPLGDALHVLRMSGSFYARSELSAPWGLTLPPDPQALWFHVVTVGGGWLEVDGTDPRYLRPGDFALVPHGDGHRLRSDPDAPAPPVDALAHDYISDRYAQLHHGGGGASTSLVCGTVRFGHPAARNLVDLLPRTIVIETSSGLTAVPETEWMHATLRLIAAEASAMRPGGEAVITRLSDTRWRMQLAIDWLQHDDVPVAELARRLGYESEAAFSRAFKRTVGTSPGAVGRSPEARPSQADEPAVGTLTASR